MFHAHIILQKIEDIKNWVEEMDSIQEYNENDFEKVKARVEELEVRIRKMEEAL